MKGYAVYIWKKVPALRILLPLVAGILFQFYLPVPIKLILFLALVCIILAFAFALLPRFHKFRLRWLQGLTLILIFITGGMLLMARQDVRNNINWIGAQYQAGDMLLVSIEEPLVSKPKSYKAKAKIVAVKHQGRWLNSTGNVLLYLSKDGLNPEVKYGTRLLFEKGLQPVSNSGNPQAFDYRRYCAFQDIYHQAFLQRGEYKIADQTGGTKLQDWLFGLRTSVLSVLRRYIKGSEEQGVAEALLVGYRDDLDKQLVQAYSNTGVIHIIAISGLHLGLIYAIVRYLLTPLSKKRRLFWVRPVVLIAVLWLFTLLTGAAPSILRSAIMFSALILGELLNRKASTYNTLAVSAICMLWFNPYFLWDVGFQLSFAAVVSIVTFQKPVYNWIYVDNKILDAIWKLNAVTISAQILTLPFLLYYFHQFPILFIVTNFVAIPLSGWILFAEIALLGASLLFKPLAVFIATCTTQMLRWMNSFIRWMDSLPGATVTGIQLSLIQSLLLAVVAIFAGYWLMQKAKPAFWVALIASTLLLGSYQFDVVDNMRRHKLIVYNIPKHTCIDIMSGNALYSVQDSLLAPDPSLLAFHILPARIYNRITSRDTATNLQVQYPFYLFRNKKILFIDRSFHFRSTSKIPVDLIVLSGSPRVEIAKLLNTFTCNKLIADASNPQWKIKKWKKDCDSLHLPHHFTTEKGAFEWTL